MSADLIIKSKKIFTALQDVPQEAAVIIQGKRILDVVHYGEELKYADEHTRIVDAGEKLVMPGFIDAHTHFFQGSLIFSNFVCTEIEHAISEEDCACMIGKFAADHPEMAVIRGFGWFLPKWKGSPSFPTRDSLDKVVPDRPVYMVCADTHSMWLNTKALEMCNITADMPVKSGYIGTDETGKPDGMLVEPDAYAPAMKKFTEFSDEETLVIFKDFLKKAAELGITGMSEMYAEDYTEEIHHKYSLVKKLEMSGALSLRLSIFTRLFGYDQFEKVLDWKKEMDSDCFQIAGVKGFIDGVVETYTGLLTEPYSDRPDTCGIGVPLEPRESIQKSVSAANAAGLPVRLHCIADGSVHMALDIFAESNRINGKRKIPNTIEHIENILPEDLNRFAQEEVIPSMQPMHLLLDNNFKKVRIGRERALLEWPIRTLLEKSGAVALGSDFPVVEPDPLHGIYAAVTRKSFDGIQEGENPWETITLSQALRGYTIDAAKVYGMENRTGSLEKGKYADIIILESNLFETDVDDLWKKTVNKTIFNGKVIFEK